MPTRHRPRDDDDNGDREDGGLPHDHEMQPEDRWTYVYMAGRRDGAHEAKVNHRFDQVEGRVHAIETGILTARNYLFGLAVAAISQLGLMVIGIATTYFVK